MNQDSGTLVCFYMPLDFDETDLSKETLLTVCMGLLREQYEMRGALVDYAAIVGFLNQLQDTSPDLISGFVMNENNEE